MFCKNTQSRSSHFSRSTFLTRSIQSIVQCQATCQVLPALSRWTNWCYGSSPVLLYDHSRTIPSSCGVQQGDPLGPLYFCFGIASLVSEVEALHPIYNKWYMD